MKIFKSIIEQIKKLNGISGIIIKIYLIVSLIYFSVLFITFIGRITYEQFFQKNIAILDAPIKDAAVLDKILIRLNEEDIKVTVTPNGILFVEDKQIARRARTILITEDLIPPGFDPWEIYDVPRWTVTDFERDVSLKRARERMLENHIKTIDGIHDVRLIMAYKNDEYYPFSASLTIIPEQGSDITKNQQKIEDIKKYLLNSIEGLSPEYITILDQDGYSTGDFIEYMD